MNSTCISNYTQNGLKHVSNILEMFLTSEVFSLRIFGSKYMQGLVP